MPSGSMSGQLMAQQMGEITTTTGREVRLIRLGDRLILGIGWEYGIDMSDASRVIERAHPSDDLKFSGVVGDADVDIPVFSLNQPQQRSGILIAIDGSFISLPIPRQRL